MRKKRLTKAQREILAMQASLDRLKAGGRRLDALKPVTRRMGELMCEHGPSPIRSYALYLTAYQAIAALSREHAPELVERSKPGYDRQLTELDAKHPWQAEEFHALFSRGVQDALDGKPPAPAPEGFPDELLEA
jgi:hypothetical protein